MDELSLKRSQIRPDTKLDDIIEPSQRHEIWCRFMGVDPSLASPLIRPAWLRYLVIWAIPALACTCIITGSWLLLGLIIAVGFGIAVIGEMVTPPFQTEFPHQVVEVRDLVRFVAAPDNKIWTKEDVFRKIRGITAAQFGIDESEVTLETDFVKDLGC